MLSFITTCCWVLTFGPTLEIHLFNVIIIEHNLWVLIEPLRDGNISFSFSQSSSSNVLIEPLRDGNNYPSISIEFSKSVLIEPLRDGNDKKIIIDTIMK